MHPKFIFQAVLSYSVLLFCATQIDKGQNTEVVWSVVTFILGYWLPSPVEK
jgi:hypothetical protein